MPDLTDIRVLGGADFDSALDDVARLRIRVFRDWPYLYDGDLDYERTYLQSYRNSDGAILVGAFDADRLVGASTGAPLADHADGFTAAFANSGLDMGDIFYCAESVLLPDYRGQRAGHRFFDLREDHARKRGFGKICFCSVLRPADHPLRPENHTPLDRFWLGRGYRPMESVVAHFSWKDVDQPEPTQKPLQFWMRAL